MKTTDDLISFENYVITPEWPVPSNVKSIITTRKGGISENNYASFNIAQHVEDNPEHVLANRSELRKLLPSEPVWLSQVHGNRVIQANSNTSQNIEADAAVTNQPKVVLSIQTADCLPLLLCNQQATVVGACHAGWKGLANDVIENTVQEMQCSAETIIAYLGPAIGPEKFEVGKEVREVFVNKHSLAAFAFVQTSADKWLADIYALARIRLSAIGVTNIYGGDFCTFSEETRFFSYRRDKQTGRMASLIWLTK